MAVIATIEDTIVSALEAAFAGTKVPVQTLPAGITAEEWGARLRAGTALYVAWIGASPDQAQGTARLTGDFAVYVVSQSSGKEEIRRRGNGVRQGAYLMIEIAVPSIHNLNVPGIGTLQLGDIVNYYSEDFDKLGVAVYGINFRCQFAFDPATAVQDLLTFGSQIVEPGQTLQTGETLPLPEAKVVSTSVTTLPAED
jgi:phage gp37-like protein